MKVTNISGSRLYLSDLRLAPEGQTVGRRGEDKYLGPGDFAYFPDTSEVLRSAHRGTLRTLREKGFITLNDVVTLAAFPGPGNSILIPHNLGYLPLVVIVRQVGLIWVDATGIFDLTHNVDFTNTTVVNAAASPYTVQIKVS